MVVSHSHDVTPKGIVVNCYEPIRWLHVTNKLFSWLRFWVDQKRDPGDRGFFLATVKKIWKGGGSVFFFWSHPVPFSMYFVWLWWLESRVPLKYILPSLILCCHTSCSCLEKNIPAFNFRHSQSHSPSLRYPLLAAWARKDLSFLTADQGIEDSVNEIENV